MLSSHEAVLQSTMAPSVVQQLTVPEICREVKEKVRPPIPYEKVVRVETLAEAERCLKRLNAMDHLIHAVDTEVADIDLRKHGPVGHGVVTCFTVYSGPEGRFDDGEPGKALWVETVDDAIFNVFVPWLESAKAKKIYHNYAFDRHVLENKGIDVKGFAGDTMHMARLHDAARMKRFGAGEGYSLESLSKDYLEYKKVSMHELFDLKKAAKLDVRSLQGIDAQGKRLFADEDREALEDRRAMFACYAAYDAKATWELHGFLKRQLQKQSWEPIVAKHRAGETFANMFDFYEKYMVPFGHVLTDMEKIGIFVEKEDHLAKVEKRALEDKKSLEKTFREWIISLLGDDTGRYFNPASTKQIQILLYGGSRNEKSDDVLPTARDFDVDKDLIAAEENNLKDKANREVTRREFADRATAEELKDELRKLRQPTSGLKIVLAARFLEATSPEAQLEKKAQEQEQQAQEEQKRLRSEEEGQKPKKTTIVASDDADDGLPEWIKKMKVKELRDELKRLKVEGTKGVTRISGLKKEELQVLLREVTPSKDHEAEEAQALPQKVAQQRETSPSSIEKREKEAAMRQRLETVDMRGLRGMLHARCIKAPKDPSREELLDLVLKDESDMVHLQEAQEAQKALSPGGVARDDDYRLPGAWGGSYDREAEESASPKRYKLKVAAKGKRTIRVEAMTNQLKATKFTATGWPMVSAAVLRDLAGQNPSEGDFGEAYAAFGKGDAGKRACVALEALCKMSAIEKMLSTFILPLQEFADAKSRVHCSLNLNTETGRLSSRKPNLQNQPALEKDVYQIRKAFRAEPGKMLVVADYGQLELRLLAAITECKSMLEAFEAGGCFHSRTAVGMFDYVKQAVDSGEVLLEKGSNADDDERPLVKDRFGAERRKAKTLNFSIAYGKTAHGLAKDWGVSPKEAQELLDAWYADRPEVKRWQAEVIKDAMKTGYTTTLMGRRRQLPDIQSDSRRFVGAGQRAAINTPIQGSAADVVMMAMINLSRSEELKEIGWKLLLQIHDEVILEGPEEYADRALQETKRCMENPYDGHGLKHLDVALTVDAAAAKTWYDAK